MDYKELADRLEKRYKANETGSAFVTLCSRRDVLNAATALSTLQAENESLKEKLYDGEGVNLVDYWMQQAKIEENGHRNCQAENEQLRAELEYEKEHANAYYEECGQWEAENTQLKEKLEALKQDRDAIEQDFRAFAKQWWEEGSGSLAVGANLRDEAVVNGKQSTRAKYVRAGLLNGAARRRNKRGAVD